MQRVLNGSPRKHPLRQSPLGCRVYPYDVQQLPTRCIAFFSRASPAAAAASPTTTTNSSSDTTPTIIVSSSGEVDGDIEDILAAEANSSDATTASVIVSSSGEVDGDIEQLLAAGNRDAAERIARAAAALDERAAKAGFVPSAADAHLDITSRLNGPRATAMGDFVTAVYGAFAGDGKAVERSVEHLTTGMAGVSHRPLTTRWTRNHASSSTHEDADEAAAIRETLTAYRFAGMAGKPFVPEPEAPPATEAPADAPVEAATARASA